MKWTTVTGEDFGRAIKRTRMEKPRLPLGYCRCNGEGCARKDDCLRFTDKGKGAYVAHMAPPEGDCKFFIPNSK